MTEKQLETKRLHNWFRTIWDERQDEYDLCYCFETGTPMERYKYRSLTTVYDHVLEKQKSAYPQYKYIKKNIVIVLPEVHIQKTVDIDSCPKIKAYRDYLLQLHDDNNLNDE